MKVGQKMATSNPRQEPKAEEIIDITGPEGETLFRHALAYVVAEQGPKIQSEMDELWSHYKDVSDERLLALIAALCIENSIQELLQALGPGFSQLEDDVNYTFSLKIKTARALRIIPSRILTGCDLIRQIRNEFAHHLDTKQLSQLDPKKYLEKLAAQVFAFNSADRDKANHSAMFSSLVGFVLMALRTYIQHVRRFREYLDANDFRESFKAWAERK
jgi:hypothetical protein